MLDVRVVFAKFQGKAGLVVCWFLVIIWLQIANQLLTALFLAPGHVQEFDLDRWAPLILRWNQKLEISRLAYRWY